MEKPIVKAFALLIIVLLSAVSGFAYGTKKFEDTTRKVLMASINKKTSTNTIILKEANVEFPSILSGNEIQSIDYIEKFSTNRKDYLIRTYNKGKKLFPKAAAILKKYNVPKEFQVLLALESGFNANALSSAGAVGYWQIMDEVAREYGLRITEPSRTEKPIAHNTKKHRKPVFVDERKNFERSTHAAARYLKDRSRNLNGDWLLIAASYNCGVGNVWNAMKKSGKENPTFWDIQKYLPAETRAYVMNFITLNVVFNNYEKFSKNKLCFKTVTTEVTIPDNLPELNVNAFL